MPFNQYRIFESIKNNLQATTHQKENAKLLYLYDDCAAHISRLDTHHNGHVALAITNDLKSECIHFCVDGGIIPYGQSTYNHGKKIYYKRCDSLVITDRTLFLIECKLNVDVNSEDRTKWDEYHDAMLQISEFYSYMQNKIPNLHCNCPVSRIVPFIAIRVAPCFANRKNSQRNNEKEKFRAKTSCKIRHGSELNLVDYH